MRVHFRKMSVTFDIISCQKGKVYFQLAEAILNNNPTFQFFNKILKSEDFEISIEV